ncbi:MAG TPA: hypothetical protein VK860_11435, partial [Ilumatobacteraceae bacterium]|nr:hypothetical protein [Ilumatobacteraceae bacterium]
MPAATRAQTAATPRPFPPAVERAVSSVGGPMSWLWTKGFRFLVVLDAIALYSLMVIISFVRFGFSFDWDTYPLSRYFVGFAIATLIHLVVNYFTGLYEREPRLGVRPWLPRALLATGIGVAVQGLAFVLLDRYLMPRLNLAVFLTVASFVLVANRQLSRTLARRRQGAPRVVLVGEPGSVELADRHLAETDRDATVVARVRSPHLLTAAVVDNQATDVLLMDVTAFGSVYPEPLNSLDSAGVGFLQRVSARETLLGLKTVRQVGGMPFVPLRLHTVPGYKVRLKRLFDLVVVLA